MLLTHSLLQSHSCSITVRLHHSAAIQNFPEILLKGLFSGFSYPILFTGFLVAYCWSVSMQLTGIALSCNKMEGSNHVR